MSVTLRDRYAAFANRLIDSFSRVSAAAFTPISNPCALISPILSSCVLRKPPDGANWRLTRTSLVTRFQYVMFRPSRLSKKPISPPTSSSVETSGFRSSLPRLSGETPGPSDDASGPNVVNLSNAPGCSPDFPSAARRRRVLTRGSEKPSMSLGTKDTDVFGYSAPPALSPNAEWRSKRAPTVANSQSRKPTCSCAYTPAFTVFSTNSSTLWFAPAPVTSRPGAGNWSPLLSEVCRSLIRSCAPATNDEDHVAFSSWFQLAFASNVRSRFWMSRTKR